MKKYLSQSVAGLLSCFVLLACNQGENKDAATPSTGNTVSLQEANGQQSPALAADVCTELNELYTSYMAKARVSADGAKKFYDSLAKANIDKQGFTKFQQPLEPNFGEGYIGAYQRSTGGRNQTRTVTLNKETVAFLYMYLHNNPNKSIGLSFGQYDENTGQYDLNYATANSERVGTGRTSIKNLNSLIIGEANKTVTFGVKPFKVSGYDPFYDDWNDVWP